jgi:hypothetical protein
MPTKRLVERKGGELGKSLPVLVSVSVLATLCEDDGQGHADADEGDDLRNGGDDEAANRLSGLEERAPRGKSEGAGAGFDEAAITPVRAADLEE